jgi:hypothetical protein
MHKATKFFQDDRVTLKKDTTQTANQPRTAEGIETVRRPIDCARLNSLAIATRSLE